MPRSIVYTTQANALAAKAQVDARFRTYLSTCGYAVDGSGYVTPKRRSDMTDATGGTKTTTFGAVSGSASTWTFPHPETHSAFQLLAPSLAKSFVSYALQDISGYTISGTVDTYDLSRGAVGGWAKHSPNALPGFAGVGTFFDPWPVKDGSTYIMYSSWRQPGGISRCTSSDGINWSAPTIVLPNSGVVGSASRASVVRMSSSDWRMWYTRQLGDTMNIHYATSTDGITWTTSDTPVMTPTQAWESQTDPVVQQPVVLWDATASKFKMWYAGGASYEPVAVGYAESTDGVTWTKNGGNPIFSADTNRLWEQAFVGVGTVIVYGGYYVMFYIGYRSANEATICVARSADGVTNWERHSLNPLLRASTVSTDQDLIGCYRPGVLFDGTDWRLWYNGRNDSLTYTENIMLATHVGADLLW